MIAGLDPSTSRTGLAHADGTLRSFRPRSSHKYRARRLSEIAEIFRTELRLHPPRPLLIALEGPALHSPGPLGMIRLGEVRGVILRELHELDVVFVEIEPGRLKRFATGNGAADKDAMIESAREAGANPRNDDEADAFHLRRMARCGYGLETARPGHELEAVAAATWPTLDLERRTA